MKYIKHKESFINIYGVEKPEVLLVANFLKSTIDEIGPAYSSFMRIEQNKTFTYSIFLDVYKNYFVFQFDYKVAGLWIKYHSQCQGTLQKEINKLKKFFDAIALEHTEFGWRFDPETFKSEFENIDFYIDAHDYNL